MKLSLLGHDNGIVSTVIAAVITPVVTAVIVAIVPAGVVTAALELLVSTALTCLVLVCGFAIRPVVLVGSVTLHGHDGAGRVITGGPGLEAGPRGYRHHDGTDADQHNLTLPIGL